MSGERAFPRLSTAPISFLFFWEGGGGDGEGGVSVGVAKQINEGRIPQSTEKK